MGLTEHLKNSMVYLKRLVKWTLVAAIVGILGGIFGSLFHMSIDYVTDFRTDNGWIIFLLPLGGLAITGMYRLFKKQGGIDTNRVIDAVRTEEKVPVAMAPLIFIGTVITHLLGGSAGREGAALQLGGSIGYSLGRAFRLNSRDRHIIVMSGMSAVFAALFGTPVTAMFFALEVTSVGVMYYAALVPCVISALVASRIALMFGLSPVRFEITAPIDISAAFTLQIILLAAMCAVIGILFCFSIKRAEHYMEKFAPNPYVRAFLGGTIIVLLTVLLGTRDYNGAGMEVIIRAIEGNARPEAFILKILFTAVTVAAGFKGGEIVPAFFVGSTFGCIAGQLLGIDASIGAAIGFVALFCSVVNCPVASVFLAVEVFGGEGILVFAAVCGISYMMSGYSSLYKSQRFIYSKLEDKYINIESK